MNIVDIALMLREIPKLRQQAYDIYFSNPEEQANLGLITPQEKAVLEEARNTHHNIQVAQQEASDKIPYPSLSEYAPPEFLGLLNRQKELKTQTDEIHKVFNAVRELKVWDRTPGQHSLTEALGLNDLAETLLSLLNALPNPFHNELRIVERSIENKSRVGTKIAKRRMEEFAKCDEAKKAAKAEVAERMEAEYKDLFASEHRIKLLLQSRIEKRLQPIRAKIKTILEETLEALEET